jgi:uncharacterized membrane protein YqhA
VLLGVRGLWLLGVLLLCVRELLTRCRRVQSYNQIVDLQGVQFPAGLQVLDLVSLRAVDAVAVVMFGLYAQRVSAFDKSIAKREILAPESARVLTKECTRESIVCATNIALLKKNKSKLYLCNRTISAKMINPSR